MKKGEAHCCCIGDDGNGCAAPAEWVLEHGYGFEAYTHVCTAHVGAMLTDAHEHRIFPIAMHEEAESVPLTHPIGQDHVF